MHACFPTVLIPVAAWKYFFIRVRMVTHEIIGIPRADLHPYFPDLMVCQPWKIVWLHSKLVKHTESALNTIGRYVSYSQLALVHDRLNKLPSLHIEDKQLLDAYRDAVNLSLKLSKTRPDRIPPELAKDVESVQTKMNNVCQI